MFIETAGIRLTRRHLAAVLSIGIAFLLGCSSPKVSEVKPPQPAPGAGADNATAAADNAAPVPFVDNVTGGKPLFRVNGEGVNSQEVMAYIELFASEDMGKGPTVLPGIVDSIINNRLLAARAVKEGLDKNPGVRSRLMGRVSPIWRDVYWTELVKPTVRIKDSDFKKEIPKFEEVVNVQQMVVSSKEKAEELLKRAKKGENFDELCKANSEGLTASRGGKVGYIKRGSPMFDAALIETFFKTKVGEFTPVAETPIGFTFSKILERKSGEQQAADWYKDNRPKLVKAAEQKAWELEKERLVKRRKIKIDSKVAKAFADAKEKKAPVDSMMDKTLVTIDGIPMKLSEFIDPSGMGIIHGEESLDTIVRKKVHDVVLDFEAEKRGIKAKYPEMAMRERLMKERYLARDYVSYRARDQKVSPEERQKYFDLHKDRFYLPRALELSFIETRTKERADKIYAELKKGRPFAEVADEWSDNKVDKGGRAGFVNESGLSPELVSIKQLKVGQYATTPLVVPSTKDKKELYVIPRLDGIRERRPMTFAEADKETIDKAIAAEKREEVVKQLYKELREANKVEFTPEFDAFKKAFGTHNLKQGGVK